MKKIWFVFFLVKLSILNAQYVIKNTGELQDLKKLPQEKVYLHHTGPLVLSGEYLYYSFSCFNALNNRLSNISQIGYVALINENHEFVKEQKLHLSQGLSTGDFFIGTDIPSGNYKLVGYTQWMKNNGLEQVFKDDLVIINPYLADQGDLSGSENNNGSNSYNTQEIDSSVIQFRFDKKRFGVREKVNLLLRNYKNQLGYGTYTIKVMQKTPLPVTSSMTSIDYAKTYFNVAKEIDKKVGDSLFLPEQRGELLFGTVLNKETLEPVENTEVVLSMPGKEFILKFANTNEDGNFYTYLRSDFKEPRAILQLKEDSGNNILQLKSTSKLDIAGINFGSFVLHPDYAEVIKERSVHNQLENQFFSMKPDSVILNDPIDPFDGGTPETLILDDYTRFKTFEETLVELFQFAGYRNNGKENDYIRIAQDFETYNEAYNDFPAIVIIDGVFIPNHEKIKDFDAYRIKEISLIRDQFRLGEKDYQGMLVVETFDGDFFKDYIPENGLNEPIEKSMAKKNYYVQGYKEDDSSFAKIPDYRKLLLWEPNIAFESSSLDFEFYTSDIKGEFDVVLDGFTTYGKPIYLKSTIVVE